MMSRRSNGFTPRAALLGLVLAALASEAFAGDTVVDDYGVLNPQEFSMDAVMRRIEEKRATNFDCIAGYEAAKAGMHVYADRIFTYCAEKGITGALPWMAWLEENGYTHPSNPAAAAEWDRRSAEMGSSVGELNYGLDLLRGHGVERDPGLGRRYVDRAAEHGDETARRLARSGYDPDSVTPDADEARYRKPLF